MTIKIFLILLMSLALLVPASSLAQPNPTLTPTNTTRYQIAYLDSNCFFGQGEPGCIDTSGHYVIDKLTGKTYKIDYRDGLPLCGSEAFNTGAVGTSCYDEGDDPTDPEEPRICLPYEGPGGCNYPPTSSPEPTPTPQPYICSEQERESGSAGCLERRPPCTPDGPECPPCPEGLEAGWCQDEDERQDTDDCLRPDGTERFPGCSDNGDGNGGGGNGGNGDEIEIDIPSLFGEDENENGNGGEDEPERNPEPVID